MSYGQRNLSVALSPSVYPAVLLTELPFVQEAQRCPITQSDRLHIDYSGPIVPCPSYAPHVYLRFREVRDGHSKANNISQL